MKNAPQSEEELDELASEPDRGVIDTLSRLDGDVLVAGAGGKMGFHLSLMLRRGFDVLGMSNRVIAVSRFEDEAVRGKFESRHITTISADLTDPETVSSLPEASSVFFLAGKKFGTVDSTEVLKRFNQEMPSLVAERFGDSSIVALSTGCVYSFVDPGSGGSKETDEVGPVGAYALSCLGREAAFLRGSEAHGTPLALIRLNYAVDLRYGVLVDLALKVRAGEPVDLAMGYFNCIWQGDAVACAIRALDHVSPAPEAFVLNVTGPRTLSVRDVAFALGEMFGRSVEFRGEEAETAWLNNAAKSHRMFGAPNVPEERLISWVADWIDHERPVLNRPTHFEVRDGKY